MSSITTAPFKSLATTIGWPAAKVTRFDRFRQKRNIGRYETAGLMSGREAREIHELAASPSDDVVVSLRKNDPKLLRR